MELTRQRKRAACAGPFLSCRPAAEFEQVSLRASQPPSKSASKMRTVNEGRFRFEELTMSFEWHELAGLDE